MVIIEVLLGYRNTFEETRDPWSWVVRPVVGLYRATPHDVPVRPCARTAKHISHPTSSYFEKVLQIFDRERPFLWEGRQIFTFILDAVRRRPDREQGQPNGPEPNRRCGRYFGAHPRWDCPPVHARQGRIEPTDRCLTPTCPDMFGHIPSRTYSMPDWQAGSPALLPTFSFIHSFVRP